MAGRRTQSGWNGPIFAQFGVEVRCLGTTQVRSLRLVLPKNRLRPDGANKSVFPLHNEIGASAIRFAAFISIVLIMAAWEWRWPRRKRRVAQSRLRRWPSNFGIVMLNGVAARFLLPISAVGVAVIAQQHSWGIMNELGWSGWITIPVSVLLLDLTIYVQHVLFHKLGPLWRIHRMHHTDLDLDVSSGGRFHTIEILLSALIKAAAVVLIGAPAIAVVVFEVVLNATATFNHANAYLPPWLDRVLRLMVVTPDMHRVHHSIIKRETDSNYGFNFPWWDRLFGTYRDQPEKGQLDMTLGIESFRDPKDTRFDRMWMIPFRDR